MANNNKEPNTAPQPDRWYNLTLGSSLKDLSSTKFCTLRYEFKPASIDKNQPGSLHKTKENRVTVEFHNNQPGKPKVSFEGSSEDYKDNDGVLFFDGETFRLDRLHRAVKRLRHVRLPGESAAAASMATSSSVLPSVEPRSPPLGKAAKSQPLAKTIVTPVPVEVERIDIGESGSPGVKPTGRAVTNSSAPPNSLTISADHKNEEEEEHLEILFDDDDDDDDAGGTPNKGNAAEEPQREVNTGLDINMPNQNDTDDEIADVDVSDDDADNGPNAAEALRAQVNAEERDGQTSSSSASSASGSSASGSGSGSSSSDSEGSDDDSVNSI
ncbi:ELL-associated factor 2 [Telopea speciosissima]|uniref:ELL-associated factor 2 n=1 Tax=Telopea speciosissima TaxID=54955 RepID=UPI001CC7FBF6|nr:ELL-associated factor 2 [Telopea speciosissima]